MWEGNVEFAEIVSVVLIANTKEIQYCTKDNEQWKKDTKIWQKLNWHLARQFTRREKMEECVHLTWMPPL